jgi:DNA-binding response OmpR family regulator
MASRSPLVAVLNNDPDLINMLATWFEAHGIRVVCASLMNFRRGHEDVAQFLDRHDPTAVVVDVSLPYGPNWDYLCALRLIPETSGVPIVVTTTNKTALEKVVGLTDAMELNGSAENLTSLTTAIQAAHLPGTSV